MAAPKLPERIATYSSPLYMLQLNCEEHVLKISHDVILANMMLSAHSIFKSHFKFLTVSPLLKRLQMK